MPEFDNKSERMNHVWKGFFKLSYVDLFILWLQIA